MSPDRRKISYSISIGLSTAFVLVIVLISLSLVLLTNQLVKTLIFQDVQTQLRDIAAVGTLMIDGDAHRTLISADQENTSAYKNIKDKLYALKTRTTGVRYVYTMRQQADGTILFVVDAEQDISNISHVGDIYMKPSEALLQVFKDKSQIIVEDHFTTDKWGTWVSGFAPFYAADGKFEGVLGVDISAQHVKDYQAKALQFIFIATGVIIGFMLLIALFISRRITRPLALIEQDIDQIQHLNLDESVAVNTHFREISSMNHTLNNMKKALKSFRKYVPAELVTELIRSKEEASLHVERKNITMLFSDIKNFTVLAESISSADLIEIMSGYFGGLSQIVLTNHGVVDKYIGDAVMAFWGAPLPLENREYFACKSALESIAYLEDLNVRLASMGLPIINTRIGIHTGEALVGNIGYDQRLNYTALGDNVNLSSRIEGINKFYHTQILISETVYRQVARQVYARKLDCVVVKGKKTGIDVYHLMGLRSSANEDLEKICNLYEEGMAAFYQRRFEIALAIYEKVLARLPEDAPSKIQIDLCKAFLKTPPEEGWTGLRVFDTK